MKNLIVDLNERSYPIIIGSGILESIGDEMKKIGLGKRVAIVTNPSINELYGNKVNESLINCGFLPFIVEIPEGENSKTLQWADFLYDNFLSHGMDRGSCVIALGGGVIGDLAGFAAATYMRGISYVQIPTSLLSQVDSSVGGKVAVNHPRAKNIIGAFHQPKLVLIDVSVLKTLQKEEYLSGMAEVIKYGIILDKGFFDFLEKHRNSILDLEMEVLQKVIFDSCRLKASIIQQDEREDGLRAILNYGHTVGHALEALTEFGKYKHGEAVAIGMVCAARISYMMDLCSQEDFQRQLNQIKSFGLPVKFYGISPELIVRTISFDKKSRDGNVPFVLIEGIGKAKFGNLVNTNLLFNILNEVQEKYTLAEVCNKK